MKTILILMVSLWCSSALAQTSIKTANAQWPPWRIERADGSLYGLEIDLLESLSAQLNLTLETKNCGWKRCLKHMQLGESDVITGLYRTAERERYMYFVEPPYRTQQHHCFYLNKNHQVKLADYQDLYALKVGIQSNVVYFSPFDEDKGLTKHNAIDDQALFRLLRGGRVDTVLMSCAEGDAFLQHEGLFQYFEHAEYVHSTKRPVYLAVSKLSPLAERLDELSSVLKAFIEDGELDALFTKYQIQKRD